MSAARVIAVPPEKEPLTGTGTAKADVGVAPLLGEDVKLDDDEACVIFVFKKHIEDGAQIVDDPWGDANKIFFRTPGHYPDKLEPLRLVFEGKKVTKLEYGTQVREYFKKLLHQGGFIAKSTESIDGDEWLLRLRCGEDRIKELAEFFRYKMPFTNAAYEASEANGSAPIENNNGIPVPGFTEFNVMLAAKEVCDSGHTLVEVDHKPDCKLCRNAKGHKEGVKHRSCATCDFHVCGHCKAEGLFKPFRHIDQIRLVNKAIESLVSIEDLEEQGVAAFHFPVARYQESIELNLHWVKFRYFLCFPAMEDLEKVRNYFGEQIAFFFAWFACFNRALMVLGMVSILAFLRRLPYFREWQRNYILNGFAVFLVIWNAAFIERWKTLTARLCQQWGMDNWDSEQALERRGYEKHLTFGGKIKKSMAKFISAAYLVIFGSVIMWLSFLSKDLREKEETRKYAGYIPLIISLVMKVFGGVWGKLAYTLVVWENHRTEPRFNNSLAWTLASVKLFVALFPFASIAFLEPSVKQTCARTLEKAVMATYSNGKTFPTNTTLHAYYVEHKKAPETFSDEDLMFLQKYYEPVHEDNGEVSFCVSGCYPENCWMDGPDQMCHTNCWNRMSDQLLTFYVIQVLVSAVMVGIPIVLTKVAVVQEVAKASLGKAISMFEMVRVLLGGHLKHGSEDSKMYSWTEVQAKRFGIAPYAYGSYGGSYGEDFLELMIGYALLACFGLVLPIMAMIGWVSHMLIYRLLAFRMTNVTSRPLPEGSEGIGTWQDILIFIANVATTCNVALATFFMSPIKEWQPKNKFLFFIVAQNGLTVIRTMVDALVPDKPEDVTGIEDYNCEIERALVTNKGLPWDDSTVSKEAKFDAVKIGYEEAPPVNG